MGIRNNPNCWICKDMGIVIYEKIINGRSYEMGARCSCKEGMKSGNSIPIIKNSLAEKLAVDNYKNYHTKR